MATDSEGISQLMASLPSDDTDSQPKQAGDNAPKPWSEMTRFVSALTFCSHSALANLIRVDTSSIQRVKGKIYLVDDSKLTPFEPLPENWDKSDYYWIYGWSFPPKRYIEYLEKYALPPEEGQKPLCPTLAPLGFRWGLKNETGYPYIYAKYAQVDQKSIDDGHTFWLQDCMDPSKKELAVQVLTIGCTASPKLYCRRPNPDQLRFMEGILGKPRWHEGVIKKENFNKSQWR
ncbi:hypothetical protein EST38_g5005 [Candolleomyces aberdarensis]|uniref:Uncharacterized protein n=1 Tax=Candolleomyces aberdarensis TaxID=2316362 RepID=A0A4Q2DL66_9AGAR|nr:hypothetical protein EST38_g5005 [Candolleomyces aberdarensis]